MEAIILSIGTELTTGQCLDTNAAWLSSAMTKLGVRVLQHMTVADDLEQIRAAMQWALNAADVTIATGGLGPTLDDLTRQALADVIGEPLEEDPGALAQIRAMFDRWQRPMSDSNRSQALIPRGCRVIPNARGTAPGIWYGRDHAQLFALPGVPAEMQAMFGSAIVPVLEAATGGARAVEARLHCFGMSEAKVGELLSDLMRRDRNPLIGTTASGGVITVRIVALGQSGTEAKAFLDTDLSEVRRRLGDVIFGELDDTLESAVGRMLIHGAQTVATAESCTGGLVAKRLTDVPGSSAYFLRGYVTYTNEAKSSLLGVPTGLIESKGAVSEEVAEAMASACRTEARSDYAISVTGIAGPTGGRPPEKPVGLVYLGLADSRGVQVKRLLFGEHLSRGEIRDRSCKMALNLLRLRMMRAGAA